MTIGRILFSLISVSGAGTSNTSNQQHQIHDLYTVAAGLYFCWLLSKVWMVSYEWFQKGWDYVCKVCFFLLNLV